MINTVRSVFHSHNCKGDSSFIWLLSFIHAIFPKQSLRDRFHKYKSPFFFILQTWCSFQFHSRKLFSQVFPNWFSQIRCFLSLGLIQYRVPKDPMYCLVHSRWQSYIWGRNGNVAGELLLQGRLIHASQRWVRAQPTPRSFHPWAVLSIYTTNQDPLKRWTNLLFTSLTQC